MILHTARFADLDADTLYGLLKLRVEVFVVEQGCAYPELDGTEFMGPGPVGPLFEGVETLADSGPPNNACSQRCFAGARTAADAGRWRPPNKRMEPTLLYRHSIASSWCSVGCSLVK